MEDRRLGATLRTDPAQDTGLPDESADAGISTRPSWFQRGIRPLWKAGADGCPPDRDTGTHLQQAGFSSVQFDRFSIGVPPVSPHIVGTATK